MQFTKKIKPNGIFQDMSGFYRLTGNRKDVIFSCKMRGEWVPMKTYTFPTNDVVENLKAIGKASEKLGRLQAFAPGDLDHDGRLYYEIVQDNLPKLSLKEVKQRSKDFSVYKEKLTGRQMNAMLEHNPQLYYLLYANEN